MKLGAPSMFIWLFIVPVLVIFYMIVERTRQKLIEVFAEKTLHKEIMKSVDIKRKKMKNTLIIAGIFFSFFSLLRPQWGFQWQEVKRQGIDILIALDTSKSMLAEDVLPNRLERAKLAIKDLVKKLHGDRVGLVVFSGSAFLQCPLTADYDGFLLSLNDAGVDTVPIGGTSLSKSIYTSITSYEKSKTPNKVLIIITDGEDLEGGLDRAIQTAKTEKIEISCVGIGSTEGEIIPVIDEGGKRSFIKDTDGNIVRTRLVEEVLQELALQTGGMYVRATGADFGLDLIYEQKLSKQEKQEFKSKMEKRYHERFQIPLGIAFFLVLLETILGDRKKGCM